MQAESVTVPPLSKPAAVQPAEVRLFYSSPGVLRLQVGEERSFLKVKVCRVAPLSHPDSHVAFLDGKGYEICTVHNPAELSPESRRIAEAELALRYLTARVESIVSLTQEFSVSYWVVETDRGRRDFVVQGLNENCVWLGEDHIMLIDVDSNRFEIPSLAALDERSRLLVQEII